MEQTRARFFNVEEPFEIAAEQFDSIWSHVSNIWSIVRRNEPKNANHSEVYICRLNKRSKSSTRQEDVPTEKRRKTKFAMEICALQQ